MNWFVWRQHRKQFFLFVILLAAFAALLIPTGNYFWHTYQHALSTCVTYATPGDPRGTCNTLADNLFTSQTDGAIKITVALGTFALPILVGLFIGSPLFAREYEEGTNKLAWTQSVSRRKWLTAKLTWALAFAAVYGLALTLLVTWWSRTTNALFLNRFIQGHFETQGLMPIAYSVFFTAVAFMAGAWARRTVVAFGVTIAVFALCMASFAQWIRPHYMAPAVALSPVGVKFNLGTIDEAAWVLTRDIVDKDGRVVDSFTLDNIPPRCQTLLQNAKLNDQNGVHIATPGDTVGTIDNCLNSAGYHQQTTYQPSYRYWDFQRIEAGVYLGLTALVIGATYWLVLRRDA